ncbi:probable flavin-containing monoamine oxidase A [Pomacea canaliculata]|uniref:probable flavin-containing monoamine oxidase A n=1 Tax=Pomacea canaliculata TaxID=400727 RepID=UPI000D727D95|nr:probable flavin-containing monoamine oxidase A [Pomacea canaliculata]
MVTDKALVPMAEGSEIKYDVIVIGGGISGLTTAFHLKKRDPKLRIIVLEAKDRVGGRTQTISLKSKDGTDKWDIGGQWVGRCQPHIMSLLLELGLETHPQYTKGKKIQQLSGPNISTFSGDLPSLSIFALIDLHHFISKVESCRKLVKSDDPYACPLAEEWDSISAEHFIQENCFTQGAIDAVNIANRTIFGTESSQLSCLFWFAYISAADGIIKLCEAKEFTAQESTIKGGAQKISELLAERIGHKNILLQQPVVHIEQTCKDVKVTTKTGETYIAKYAVSAMPPPLLDFITFSPSLPEFKREMCKRMTLGNYTKIIITYQEAFWRKAGFSGEVITNGGITAVPNCSSGPLCIIYDASLYNNSPALLGFIAGDVKVEWTQQSPETRKRAVLDQAADYFGKEVYSYIDYFEKDWNQEPYSHGAPVCIMPVGSMPVFSKAIRQPFERLHFAGTETATSWCGYMNGAVQAGLRAAAEVLEKLRPEVLISEDYGALQGSTLATRPAQGLSKQRWLKQPRRSFIGASFLKWTIGFGIMVGIFMMAKKTKFYRSF